MTDTDGDLFDVNLTPKPPKSRRRIRKGPELYGFVEDNKLIKPCCCRFCKTSNETVESQNVSMSQILKACIIKILHHCLMGCLQSDEDHTDGTSETELISSLCFRLCMPHVLWVIISISDKVNNLYFTRDSLGELKKFIHRIVLIGNPLSLMSKIEAELPLSLKRFICQNVTEIDYKKLLTL